MFATRYLQCLAVAVPILLAPTFAEPSALALDRADATNAVVSGRVLARDGTRVPHAVVIFTDEAGTRTVVAAGDLGTYRVTLAPGSYVVTVEAPGFVPRVETGLVVAPGRPRSLDVTLDVVGFAEALTVIGTAPLDGIHFGAIRESPARDVADVLNDATGVARLRKGGIAGDVVVRGLQSRDLNVLVDGERVYGACPNHMDPPVFHVDYAEVERIEIARGPFDMKNHGSLGGIVNVVTRRPEPGLHATPALALGSDGFVNPALTASWGTARYSILGGGSYRRSLPYTDGRGRRVTEVANYQPGAFDEQAYEVTTAWARGSLQAREGHDLQVGYTRQDAGGVLYPYLLMDAVYDDAHRLHLRYDARAGGRRPALRAALYHTRVDHWMTDARRVSAAGMARGWSMGTLAATRTTGGRLEARVASATVGAEAFRRRWDARTQLAGRQYVPQFSIPDVVTDTAGAFVETTHAVGPVTLDAGGRIDWTETSVDTATANVTLYRAYHATTTTRRADVFPSGKVRLTWRAGAHARASAGLGHAVRVAEASERFFALQRMGTDWVGNPDLAPARHTAAEGSVAFTGGRVTLVASASWSRIDDYIAVHEQPRQVALAGVMNARARSYTNLLARLRSLEVEGGVQLSPRLHLSGEVSSVGGTQDPDAARGITSTDLAEIPPLRARLRLRYDDGRWFASAEGLGHRAQEHIDRDLGEQPTPAYAIANLSAGFRSGRLSWSAGVANLFDRAYAEHLSYQRDPFRSGVRLLEPGRQWFSNVAWRF